jgi:hypothetical protein
MAYRDRRQLPFSTRLIAASDSEFPRSRNRVAVETPKERQCATGKISRKTGRHRSKRAKLTISEAVPAGARLGLQNFVVQDIIAQAKAVLTLLPTCIWPHG